MFKKVLSQIDNYITKIFIKMLVKNKKKQKEVYLIRYYTLEKLLQSEKLHIMEIHQLSTKEIDNFKYINESTKIYFSQMQSNSKLLYDDERAYLESLVRIFKILENHNKPYNIIINITNRELLKRSTLLEYCNNINLTILNDCNYYNKEEYLKEEEILESLIKPVKESDLSPYEKYLAVYNIVKQFKPYQENKKNPTEARCLKYILNNKYMVCVGFATLLKTLLDKVGIPCMKIGVEVDTSYDEGFTREEIPTELSGHERNIIKIEDKKYGINGIFVVDATWDNNMEVDLYNYQAMTFDRKKESYRLEKLSDEDLLLDFHDIKDFTEKINYYLKKEMNTIKENNFYGKLSIAYKNLYIKIMEILMQLDYQEYLKLHDKYDQIIYKNRYQNPAPMKEIDEVFSNFLTDYATYIIPLSNKKIRTNTIYEAASNVKRIIDGYNKEKLKEWNKKTRKVNEMRGSIKFPYRYVPSESRPNYLKVSGKRKLKVKMLTKT